MKPLTTTQELVLLTELFSRNLSPKLFGFFDGGRIEEFVDSHIMTEEESFTESYERDFAINLARFNAVDAPLPKPGYDFREVLRDRTNASKENFEKFLSEPEASMLHEIARQVRVHFKWQSIRARFTVKLLVHFEWQTCGAVRGKPFQTPLIFQENQCKEHAS